MYLKVFNLCLFQYRCDGFVLLPILHDGMEVYILLSCLCDYLLKPVCMERSIDQNMYPMTVYCLVGTIVEIVDVEVQHLRPCSKLGGEQVEVLVGIDVASRNIDGAHRIMAHLP